MAQVNVSELRDKVKAMYKAVAEEPHARFHFEMGRDLARRLGYPAGDSAGAMGPPVALRCARFGARRDRGSRRGRARRG